MHRLKGRKNVNRNNIFALNKDGARNRERVFYMKFMVERDGSWLFK